MTPKTYRKKPVDVQAVQFTGDPDSAAEIERWILAEGGAASYETTDMDTVKGFIGIQTLEGRMHAVPGDYVIRGVHGEFYPCKPNIFNETYEVPVLVSPENRRIIESAFDDGDGHTITLRPVDDHPWFVGAWEDQHLYLGMEHEGVLYSIVSLSGSGSVAVIIGDGLVQNEVGVAFPNEAEAKAYVKGLTAK